MQKRRRIRRKLRLRKTCELEDYDHKTEKDMKIASKLEEDTQADRERGRR